MNWLAHFFGFYSGGGNSSHYLWWSGAGSDLGELAIIGGLISMIRARNCEVHHCWRLGRHTTAAGHKVCRVHHPDDHLTAQDVQAAHDEAAQATREESP